MAGYKNIQNKDILMTNKIHTYNYIIFGALRGPHYKNLSALIKKDSNWFYNYDKNGNLIARGTKASSSADQNFEGWNFDNSEGEIWVYEYDLQNRMIKTSYSNKGKNKLNDIANYTYDYRGLLVKKEYSDYIQSDLVNINNTESNKIVEYYEYTIDGKLLYTEMTKFFDTNVEDVYSSRKTNYIWAETKIWCEVQSKIEQATEPEAQDKIISTVYYHQTDHLGTTEVITDDSGTVVWSADYEAFGSVLSSFGQSSFKPNFTGKMLDTCSGLYYFNARWYDSDLGRFITQDPARDGNNWWAYCSNNPLTRIDLTGLNDKNAYDEMKNNIYMLRINVNLPGKGPTNDTLLSSKIEQNSQGYVALDGGHAFVSLIHINLETMDIENNSYGLYPAEKTGIIKGENVKGQIKDDSDSYYDNSFTFFITKEGYQKAKDYADVKKDNPPDYNLYTNNCVDFSISISKKAGIDIPNLPIGSSPNSLNDILQINGLFGGNK